jgi:acyl-CoA-binding protein
MSRLTDLYKRVMYGQAGMYGNHAEKSGLFGLMEKFKMQQ